jgi:TfoX/Sxy family transcriptional regulator of competence genes
MPYSEALADRIRTALGPDRRVTEIKMFGGLCLMVRGHMTCGVIGDELMLRVGPNLYEPTLKKRYARPMDFTGKPMPGMVYISAEGCRTTRGVKSWVETALEFNETLPPKTKTRKRKKAWKSLSRAQRGK